MCDCNLVEQAPCGDDVAFDGQRMRAAPRHLAAAEMASRSLAMPRRGFQLRDDLVELYRDLVDWSHDDGLAVVLASDWTKRYRLEFVICLARVVSHMTRVDG
jgi:hypothetical protein